MVIWVPIIPKVSKDAKDAYKRELEEHMVWEKQVTYDLFTSVIEKYEKKGDATSRMIARNLKEVRDKK